MLRNLSMKARMFAVFLPALAASLLCSLFLAWEGYSGLANLRAKTEELEARSTERVAAFGLLQKLLMKSSISLRDIALSGSEQERLKFVEGREKVVAQLLEELTQLKKDPSPNEEAAFKRLDGHIGEIAAAIGAFDKEWKGKFTERLPEKTVITLADMIWNVAVPIRGKVEEVMIELSELELSHQRNLADAAKQEYLGTRNQIIFSTLFAFIIAAVASAIAVLTLRSVTERLSTIARSLGRASESVESTAVSLSASSTQLAAATTQEASSIAETAAAMEEMTATIAKTVQNVATALEVAEGGQQEAERGREVVGKMITAMNEIQNSNAKLDKMVKLIEEIQDKTRVINDIVFETRLLSFNASIEAARAGSQGRGFAVVAEEVGNLAVVSGKAADEIRVLLESTTSEVNEIVRGTQERINQGRTRAEECEQAFGAMGETLSRVGQYVKGISAAAHEQDSGVKQINRAMAQLDTVTQGNAAGAEDLNAQAAQLSEDSERMSTSVAQLVQSVFGEKHSAEIEASKTEEKRYSRGHRNGGRQTARTAGSKFSTRETATSRRGYNINFNSQVKQNIMRAVNETAERSGAQNFEAGPLNANFDSNESHETIDRDDNRWKQSA